ncbi:MAG: ATPase [Rhizobiales bacterium]|nr:ATPase [Hyphomicrobiales bacterium]
MRDDLTRDLTPAPGKGVDPVELARRDQVKHLPKRFYAEARAVERDGVWTLELDGRPARTPKRRPLAHAARLVVEAVALEWAAQGERVDPATMPATRLLNVAIDAVGETADAVRADVVRYAGSDLVCYRAAEPPALVEAENEAWAPVLDWAREALGARFILAEGVVFAAQPEHAVAAFRAAVETVRDPLALAGLHAMTSLMGSAVLALAVLRGAIEPQEAWRAAHVGEDFQMRVWGQDAEALERRARRWRDMEAAALAARAAMQPLSAD